MKRNTILYRIFSLAVASILTIASQAQSFETSKIIEKSEKVSQNVTIDFSNYSADLNIVTTNGNEINICTEITVDAKTQEDAGKFIRAVEDFEFEVSDKNAQINTRFYQKMQSINGRITMTLKNGDKIKLRDYDIKHKLEIPASANLKMQNKYSDMQLGALTGKASFNLYNCELDAETFTETVEINAKYSKIRVDKFDADLELNFYDSDLNFETAKNIKATCKYSKLQGESAESLNLNSYDDKFFINSISDLKITAKYSDLVAKAKLNSCSLNLYDSNITISSAALVKFNGKYCTLDLGDVENFSISNSYDNVIQTKTVGQLEALVSKYSKMSIEQIKKFSIIGYDDKIEIDNISPNFEEILVDGKYVKLMVNLQKVPVRLECKMRHGKVQYPDYFEVQKYIDKNSMLEVIGGKGNGVIKVTGYDNSIVLE